MSVRLASRLTAGVAIVAAGAMLITGCSLFGGAGAKPTTGSSPGSSDAATGLAKFYNQKLTWKNEGDSLDSTKVTVPLDWDKPAGDTVEIAIMRHRADGKSQGSLLMNPGGPGGSGYDYVRDY